MATKKATREDYMKKYGLTTSGKIKSGSEIVTERLTENARERSTIEEAAIKFVRSQKQETQEKPATRESYMKKYGPTTTGKNQSLNLDNLRTQYQADKERRQAAEEYTAMLKNQTPKYQSEFIRPVDDAAYGAKGKSKLSGWAYEISNQDREAMIAAGKEKPSLFKVDDSFLGLGNWNPDLIRHRGSGYNYTYMNEEEKDKYYYLLGKYGLDAADDYMQGLKDTLNERSYKAVAENVKEKSKENAIMGLTGNLAGSMMSGAGYLEDLADSMLGKEYNPYGIGHGASLIEEKSREGLKEAARENIWDSDTMDFLTDTGLSMAQSLSRMPMGQAGTVYAGLGAATQATEDALERGASRMQALDQGAAQGLAEGLFEHFSIGNLQGMQEVPVYTIRDIGKNLLKQAGVEASEEMATELANTITDQLIMGDRSNFNALVNQYKAQGDSDRKAAERAIMDIGKNILIAGAGGALSGGLMGGGFAAYNGVQQARLGQSSDITNYQEFADALDTDPASYENGENLEQVQSLQKLAQELADKQANGEKISDLERGGFERDLYQMESNLMEQEQNDQIAPVQNENLNSANKIMETDNKTAENNNQTEEKTDKERYEEIREWSKDLGKNGQDAFVMNYDGNSERLEEYENAFKRYYDAGRYNVDMEAADKFAMAAILTPNQAVAAYKAGAQDRNLAEKNRPTYRQGEAKTGSMTDLTGRAGADQQNVLSHIGKKTGLDFEIVEGDDNAYGSYNQKEGVIRISLDTDNFLQTTSHELTHFVESYAPDHYEGYKSIAISALMQAQGVDYNTLYRNYEKRYEETGTTVTRDKVLNEIVADATGKFLNDEEFINNVAKENRTVAQKIMDFISDMIDSIKNLISGKGIRKAAEALSEQLEYYENARDMWAYALEEAGNRYRSGMEIEEDNTKEQFMLAHPEEVSDAKIEENFNYVRNMNPVATLRGDEFTRRDIKVTDQIMEYYDSFGNVVHNDVVGDILLKKRSVKDDVAHGIGRLKSITFQAVPDVLKKGKVLQYEKQWKGRSYDTVTIGARVDIAEGECAGEYYVACIVKVDETNRMYLHEVHTTKMDDTAPFWTGGDSKAVLPGGDNHPSISSIFEKLVNVKKGAENADGSVKFQLKDPMEETKDLIAVHNLTADKLLKTLQYDGIPMPSIAITKADLGHENFGDISLVFTKNTIDPKKNRKNKVYSADAWTPTFPRIEYEADTEVAKNASVKVAEYAEKLPEGLKRSARSFVSGLEYNLDNYGGQLGLIARAEEDYGMKAAYLSSLGEKVEERVTEERIEMGEVDQRICESILENIGHIPYEETKKSGRAIYEAHGDEIRNIYAETLRKEGIEENEALKIADSMNKFEVVNYFKKAYRYQENGGIEIRIMPDYAGMNKDIDSRINQKKYREWLSDVFGGIEKNSGIPNGKDPFTASGNRKSFKQTHYDITAANIVKSMLTQGEDAKNISGFHGIKSIRAAVAEEFKSIKDIKQASSRLENIDTLKYENLIEEMENRLSRVLREIVGTKKNDNIYIAMDTVGEIILDISKNPDPVSIQRGLAEYQWNISLEQAAEISDIIRQTQAMPVNMFEAKPQRVVGYDEIAAAVVPDNTPTEVVDALDKKGIQILEYDGSDPESRKNVVNSLEGIRFQLEGVDENTDINSLIAENQELKEANKKLAQQLNATKEYYSPRMDDVERIAGKLLRKYHSTYSKDTLAQNLSKLYTYIHDSRQLSGEEVTAAATAIGRSIIEKAEVKDSSMKEQYKDAVAYLKKTKLVLPENYRGDLESEGGYTAFRKKYFGRIRLGNEGIDVDVAYQELADLYPDLFDPSIANPVNQLMKIAEVSDGLRPTVENPYHAGIEDMAYIVGQEIFDEYFDVKNLPQSMRSELSLIKRDYKNQLDSYKKKLSNEYRKDLTDADREVVRRRNEIADQYKALGDSEEDRAKKKQLLEEKRKLDSGVNMDVLIGKMRYERRLKSQEARRHKERIMKDVQDMTNWLTKPTDKKHVPEQLKVQLAEFLKEIDYSSDRTNASGNPTRRTAQWAKLQNLYASISQNGTIAGEDGSEIYMEVDPDIVEKMGELTDRVENFDRLDDLSLNDLRTLREVVQSMKHSIQDANKFLQNERYEQIEDGARAFTEESAKRKDKLERAGLLGIADKMLRSDMLDAHTMFNRLGPAATTFYQELRDGFDKKVRNTKLAQDYIAELEEQNGITEKDIRKWSGKQAESHEFEVQGGKIKLTTAQVMSLYALNQREQARGHIYSQTGGIKSAPIVKQTKKGLVIEKSYKPVTCTPLDVDHIIETLTPEQKRFTDGIVKFFTTQTSEWGNEVSMKLYGYKKFMAPNYFPIVSDKNYIATKESELGSAVTTSTLRNMGATKSTVYKANNPIIIEDIFDVFTRQADQMGSYNAFVVPLSDMQKFFNFKQKGVGSVKQEIERTFGKDGLEYVRQLMVDVNGMGRGSNDLSSAMIRNMKSAAVGANLRTAIQQPTAYVRAMAEIDPKYLIKGMKINVPDSEWELAKKYCPIAQWKDWGYFDINTGRSMKNILLGPENLKERIVEGSMWLAGKGDEIAWKRLWEASKAETRDLHPELEEGSEAFYEQAGKRMGEIVDRTQVVDSVLHRSQMMKDKGGMKQLATQFMSEPTKSYNMLYRAFADLALNNSKENRKKAIRSVVAWSASGITTALAAAVIDAARNDEDESYKDKYIEAIGDNIWDNLLPINIIPYAKDVISIFQGYEVQRTDMQGIQQAYYAHRKIIKFIQGESNLTFPALVYEVAKPVSTLSGVALSNAMKDIGAIVNTMLQALGDVDINYRKERMLSDIKSTGNLSTYVGLAMKAYYEGDKETGDRIIADLKEEGIDDSDIESKYVEALKEDDRTIRAAEARGNDRMVEYESQANELINEGFDRDYVIKAIRSAGSSFKTNAKKLKEYRENSETQKEKKIMSELLEQGFSEEYIEKTVKNLPKEVEEDDEPESMYSWSDMDIALDASKRDFDLVVKRIYEEKKDLKWDDEKIRKTAKQWFTTKYKPLYKNGKDAERKSIRTKLYSIKIKGKQLYSEKDFQNWMKEK